MARCGGEPSKDCFQASKELVRWLNPYKLVVLYLYLFVGYLNY